MERLESATIYETMHASIYGYDARAPHFLRTLVGYVGGPRRTRNTPPTVRALANPDVVDYLRKEYAETHGRVMGVPPSTITVPREHQILQRVANETIPYLDTMSEKTVDRGTLGAILTNTMLQIQRDAYEALAEKKHLRRSRTLRARRDRVVSDIPRGGRLVDEACYGRSSAQPICRLAGAPDRRTDFVLE